MIINFSLREKNSSATTMAEVHEQVEKIQAHTEENNDCKIKEVKR
jgi:hypothetical protein